MTMMMSILMNEEDRNLVISDHLNHRMRPKEVDRRRELLRREKWNVSMFTCGHRRMW